SEQHVRELEQRLREKEEEREETPPLRQERARAREALRMADVSATPLYQAVDFHVGTADATAGRLERILEDAGLLDALVVAPADAVRAHSAIAALPMDNRTAGIETWFASPIAKESPRGRTLADYLVVATDNASSEQPPNGLSAAIGSALRAVRVFEDSAALRAAPLGGGSAIALDGAWRHGALSGHTTGARERGRYIGLANRERARAEVIAQIKAELIEANGEHDRLERTVQLIAARLGTIESHNRSLRALPSLKGLPVLRSQVESANQDITKCEERLAEVERRVAQASKAVTDAKHHLDTACLAIPWTGERSKDAIERAITRLDRMRDAANGLQQRIDTTHRIAKDYAEAATRIPGLEESVKVAAGYVEERELAVARDAAQVQAIQDLLKRADVQQLTREISELEFAITQHGTAIDDQRSVRDKAEKALDIANEELPERESIDRAARSKAQSQLDHFVAALSAHPVTAEEAIRAREADAAAAAVADAMLKGLSSTDLGPAALDEARESAFNSMDRIRAQHTAALTDLQPAVDRVAGYTFMHHGRQLTTTVLVAELADEQVKLEATLGEDHRTLAQKFMSEEILSAIHAAIEDTNQMIDLVNAKLSQINSTKSKQLRFVWQPIALPGMTANVAEVAKLLGTKVTYWSDDDRATLVRFIEERLAYVRSRVKADDETVNYVEALKDALDYRNWYTFTMQAFTKRWAEFTDKEFGEGSEGEKAVDMLAPLFAVVHARYAVAASDAPRLIGMDEAMAGLDASNTRGLFALLANFEFAFAMTSEKLWGVSENLSGCATYQLQVDNPKDPSVFAATMFLWDGVQRTEDDHRVLNPSVSSGAAGGQGELVL
ncbi:MAG TPA: SbcC/MukB-like Walker B domain-containing protein, partial [Gemmatimonadaceae bacterium]|nr:SbcC/MukB-like Walker B domain-containing protein [Gemmatimonadaceae bacterium]